MKSQSPTCPDCAGSDDVGLSRRDFLRTVGVTAAATALPLVPATPIVHANPTPRSAAETAVKGLFESLTDEQRRAICFAWDYREKNRGLLRTHVSNNWQITEHHIRSPFYTKKQQFIIHDI